MAHPFCPGYGNEPFRSLASDYPEADVYPPGQFRTEWGPIFHRGRLDGTARIVIIGQDPAQHETVVRRILVGEAGRRVQGFLAKLGITRSYAFVNAFLYSVFGSVRAQTRRDPRLVGYRNRWLDALLLNTNVTAVLALGDVAAEAWQMWKETPPGRGIHGSLCGGDPPYATGEFLEGRPNQAGPGDEETPWQLERRPADIGAGYYTPRFPNAACPFGETWADGDRLSVPEFDYPAGLPNWMHEQDGWARRTGPDVLAKRRNVTITVPKGIVQ